MKSIEQLKKELQNHQELRERYEREFREERIKIEREREEMRRVMDLVERERKTVMEEEMRRLELKVWCRYEEQQRRYEEEFRRIKDAIRREEEREYEARIQQQNKDDCSKIM